MIAAFGETVVRAVAVAVFEFDAFIEPGTTSNGLLPTPETSTPLKAIMEPVDPL